MESVASSCVSEWRTSEEAYLGTAVANRLRNACTVRIIKITLITNALDFSRTTLKEVNQGHEFECCCYSFFSF